MNGWSLAILSNCDNDLLAKTLERMPVPVRPHRDRRAGRLLQARARPLARPSRRGRTATAGAGSTWPKSWFHDIKHAAELGLPRVWVDRLDSGEDASLATVRITDLARAAPGRRARG